MTMRKRRNAQFIILCEDKQQEVFARRFLINRGVEPCKIRPSLLPAGKQAGEQYVRENYPKQARAYRGKSNHLSVCLIVLIDADTNTVENRLNQLDSILENDSQSKRQPDEKIAIFVPKRNIETWIYYLQGNSVDEETSYLRMKLTKESDCEACVKELIQQCPNGLKPDAPESLKIACSEIQRIL